MSMETRETDETEDGNGEGMLPSFVWPTINTLVIFMLALRWPYLFPGWLGFVAGSLPFSAFAFLVGWYWNDPTWTSGNRMGAKIGFIFWILWETSRLFLKPHQEALGIWTAHLACLAALLLLPFALGRWVRRWRDRADTG